MTACRVSVAVALALGLGGSATARAGEAVPGAPPPTRVYLALALGPMVALDLSVDGNPMLEPAGRSANVEGTFGVDRRVVGWLSLGAEARIATWSSAWAVNNGYDSAHERDAEDLDAVLRLWSPTIATPFNPLIFTLAPSLGFTWPNPPSRATRAVTETWIPQRGANAGVELGCETWFQRPGSAWKLGFALSATYTRHWMTLDGQFTPVSDPTATVTARYRYVTDMILVRATILVGF